VRAALLAVTLTGCELFTFPGSTTTGPGKDPIRLEVDTESAVTGSDGLLEVTIDVPPKGVSFQVTGDSNQYVSLEQLIAPDGSVQLDWVDWVYSPRSLTLAFFPTRTTVAFDWPVRDIDGPLQSGEWTAVLATTDAQYFYAPNTPITISKAVKFDPSFDTGDVSVQIVYARDVDADAGVVEAVEGAVTRWIEVWAAQGLNLSVDYVSSELPRNLGFTYTGSPEVEAVAATKGAAQMQLVVGETVQGDGYTFGVAAGIPGTLEATPNTFVVLAWLTHAGIDGVFDADEIRLMGETMAHECGHYTGLFHPVEAYYDAWDVLDDTPECGGANACDNQLGTNLMYPYPICTALSCIPQGDLTFQQGQVMQQYVAAL
jgi:hypothetical protein